MKKVFLTAMVMVSAITFFTSFVPAFAVAQTVSSESASKTAAVEWLGFLRDGTSQYDSFIGYVRKELEKGKLSLADIGTSEEELAELRFK